jgi:hypothetical protein
MGVWPELDDDDAMGFEFPELALGPLGLDLQGYSMATCICICDEIAVRLYCTRNGMSGWVIRTSERVLYSTINHLSYSSVK